MRGGQTSFGSNLLILIAAVASTVVALVRRTWLPLVVYGVICLGMVLGQAGSLDDALRAATAGMAQWLEQDYALDLSETAQVMGISSATVKRSWSSARAFLHREISGGSLDTPAMGQDSPDI